MSEFVIPYLVVWFVIALYVMRFEYRQRRCLQRTAELRSERESTETRAESKPKAA